MANNLEYAYIYIKVDTYLQTITNDMCCCRPTMHMWRLFRIHCENDGGQQKNRTYDPHLADNESTAI